MLNADTIKTAGRLSRNRLTAQPVTPDEATLPVAGSPAAAEVLTVRQAMSRKNPSLDRLIEALDLEETTPPALVVLDSPAPFQPVAAAAIEPTQPGPVLSATDPTDEEPQTPITELPAAGVVKLERLARQSLPEGSSYQRAEVIDRIVTATGVSAQRAATGFELMLFNGVLSVTPAQTYYLSGTVPF